jgi:hypothetical protein
MINGFVTAIRALSSFLRRVRLVKDIIIWNFRPLAECPRSLQGDVTVRHYARFLS